MTLNGLQLTIGFSGNLTLEEVNSQYVLPRFKTFFSDKMTLFYQPIIYRGDQILDYDNDNGPATHPKGIYYRMVYEPSEDAYCIQYYVYCLMQNCTGFLGISNHTYEYEPIFIFVEPPNPIPYGIANSRQSRARIFGYCRFHKTEVRMRDYPGRDRIEEPYSLQHHLPLSIHLEEIQGSLDKTV